MFILKQGENLQLQINNPDESGINQPWSNYERILVKLLNNGDAVKLYEYPNVEGIAEMELSVDELTLTTQLNSVETSNLEGILNIEIAIVNSNGDSVVIGQNVVCTVVKSSIKDNI